VVSRRPFLMSVPKPKKLDVSKQINLSNKVQQLKAVTYSIDYI
jgi:hypothetical protein